MEGGVVHHNHSVRRKGRKKLMFKPVFEQTAVHCAWEGKRRFSPDILLPFLGPAPGNVPSFFAGNMQPIKRFPYDCFTAAKFFGYLFRVWIRMLLHICPQLFQVELFVSPARPALVSVSLSLSTVFPMPGLYWLILWVPCVFPPAYGLPLDILLSVSDNLLNNSCLYSNWYPDCFQVWWLYHIFSSIPQFSISSGLRSRP